MANVFRRYPSGRLTAQSLYKQENGNAVQDVTAEFWEVAAPSGGPQLTFIQTIKDSTGQDLTALGALDWRHWSGFSQNSSTRKTGGAGISNLSAIGSIIADQNAASGRTVTASDPSLSSDDAGVFYQSGSSTGWGERFTVDVGTATRKCWILFGQFSGAVKVDVSVSDTSSSAISYTYPASSIYSTEGLLVEFDVAAASAGQTATVDITCSTNIDSMRIDIQAIALSETAGGGDTVSITATQANNTAAVSVAANNNVSIAAAQANNTATVTVAANNQTSIAATQAANTAAVIVAANNQVSIAAIQADNTAAVNVTANNQVSIAATQANNTAAISVTPNNNVSVSATQAGDTALVTVSSVATTTVSIAATQANNVGAINVNAFNNANIAATQANNVGAISVATNNNVSITASQAPNTAAISVAANNTVSIAATQANNSAAVSVAQNNQASITASQAPNVAAVAVDVRNNVAINANQANNTASITAVAPVYVSIGGTQDDNLVQLLVAVNGIEPEKGSSIYNFRRYPRR